MDETTKKLLAIVEAAISGKIAAIKWVVRYQDGSSSEEEFPRPESEEDVSILASGS
jgi:hypothetical protein